MTCREAQWVWNWQPIDRERFRKNKTSSPNQNQNKIVTPYKNKTQTNLFASDRYFYFKSNQDLYTIYILNYVYFSSSFFFFFFGQKKLHYTQCFTPIINIFTLLPMVMMVSNLSENCRKCLKNCLYYSDAG